MKSLLGILFATACLCLLSACSQTDQFMGDNPLANLKKAPVTGQVFAVNPTGTDDTQAILNAFASAKAAGPGSAVQLVAGTYHLGFTEIREFSGSLTGAGKGKTILTNLPDLSPDALMAQNKVPALLTFIGGDVSVSDLSVSLSDGLIWLGSKEMNMLQFSDYSADFTPAIKHIRVNLNAVEVTDPLVPNTIAVPYCSHNGVKFAPDVLQPAGNTLITRSNIDITVSNCAFTNFWRGVYAIGCKSGNFNFGKNGGNIFTGNRQGLVINENIGIQVKIMNNEFNIPSKLANPDDPSTEFYWDGLDINTLENRTFEIVHTGNMACDIRNNTFNIHGLQGIGIMDNWRYEHPDNAAWMQILCENNTFNILKDWSAISQLFALKDAVFSNNKIAGDNLNGLILNSGIYWIPPEDPNYLLSLSENCKFLNNQFLSNALIFMDWDTQNYLVLGDLSKVFILDYGVLNKVIGLTHPGPVNPNLEKNLRERMERVRAMYDHRHSSRLRAAFLCNPEE